MLAHLLLRWPTLRRNWLSTLCLLCSLLIGPATTPSMHWALPGIRQVEVSIVARRHDSISSQRIFTYSWTSHAGGGVQGKIAKRGLLRYRNTPVRNEHPGTTCQSARDVSINRVKGDSAWIIGQVEVK